MRGLFLLPVLAAVAVLVGACAPARPDSRSANYWIGQDFKPYLGGEAYAFPQAYGVESWAYPAGTSTAEIVQRWQDAGLMTRVTRGGRTSVFSAPKDSVSVFVGPNFYNLSDSSRRGFAEVMAQIYAIDNTYLLYDSYTGRPVGVYSVKDGLYTY